MYYIRQTLSILYFLTPNPGYVSLFKISKTICKSPQQAYTVGIFSWTAATLSWLRPVTTEEVHLFCAPNITHFLPLSSTIIWAFTTWMLKVHPRNKWHCHHLTFARNVGSQAPGQICWARISLSANPQVFCVCIRVWGTQPFLKRSFI